MTDASSQTQDKKIYTRSEFEELRIRKAHEMKADVSLQQDALDLLARADKKYWVHQTNWFGEPILNLPQDMFAIQEIMFRTRPDYVLEIGAAWGGSLLFYSTIMEAIGGKGVIAVDIFIPEDLKERIGSHGKISDRIRWIEGSSTDDDTLAQVRDIIGNDANVLVILDSDHTHDHVLKELELYSQFIKAGQYLICSDTVIENLPPQEHRPRPWGPGNNPMTAVRDFLQRNDRFEVDEDLEAKLLLTCNPRGYLRRVKIVG